MAAYEPLSSIPHDRLQASSEHSGSSSVCGSSPRVTPVSDLEDDMYLDVAAGDETIEKSFQLQTFQRHAAGGRPMSRLDTPSQPHHKHDEQDEKHESLGQHRRTSDSTVHSFTLYTPDEERAVLRKFDRRLVLFMAFLYMLSFLDRSNIGNARIAGLARDLKLTSLQYEWLLTAFYITYILFEGMTLLYRIVPPHIYISLCVLSFGLIASVQSLATSFPSLLVLRALLGIGEAAFSPGIPFYLSFFFKREELALRTGLIIAAAPLSISFAGSLAWLITKLGEHGPIEPWRLLFLVEGFPSVAAAVLVWFYVPDSPEKAVYLTQREKKVSRLRLRREGNSKHRERDSGGLHWREVLQTLKDPKCYTTALMFFSCNVAFSSMPVFLPTIIKEYAPVFARPFPPLTNPRMGYTSLNSQALSAPPYLLSFLLVLLTAIVSDRLRTRSIFIILHALLAFLGYTLIALGGYYRLSVGYRYTGIYFASAGFFSAITLIITWTINNQQTAEGKGMGMVMLNFIGQCGPLVGTRLYPDSDGPFFVKGMSVCAAFMLGVAVLAAALRVRLRRGNERKWERGKEKEEDMEGLVGEKEGEGFEYML
ncbi:MAG: hypothetical protein M1835_001852 [Candelina submexicana]|nr:MAG: hypothetical protein M1835_001852 [Candelina submexicana]